ncbi:MAG: hypothetical protein L0Z50_40845, partial [Verrucomicrobiales bacterium]|nr:hypothetical protein [Verrucomicrobiales bacterium]
GFPAGGADSPGGRAGLILKCIQVQDEAERVTSSLSPWDGYLVRVGGGWPSQSARGLAQSKTLRDFMAGSSGR